MERCEAYFKSVLNEQPAFKEQSVFIHSKSNLSILVNEIFFRILLIVTSSLKSISRASLFVASPLSNFNTSIQSPSIAWRNFCKEASHLSAELFEIIGVVVCSTLLLPFTRRESNPLVKAQLWVEKIGAFISHETTNIYLVKDKIDLLEEEKVFCKLDLNQMRFLSSLSRDLDVFLKTRRIARNLDSEHFLERVDQLKRAISDKIENAIKNKKAILHDLKELLKTRNGNQDRIAEFSVESNLEGLKSLNLKIEEIRALICKTHDPMNRMKRYLDSLNKAFKDTMEDFTFDSAFIEAFDITVGNIAAQKEDGAAYISRRINHFKQAYMQLLNIRDLYFYRDAEVIHEDYVDEFIRLAKSCRRTFNERVKDWKNLRED